MEKFTHIVFDVILGLFIKIIGIAMVLSVLLQIASRNLNIAGILWTEEMGRLTFIWFCFLATAAAFEKGKHVSIDYFYMKMNKLFRTICDYLGLALILMFTMIIVVEGIRILEFVSIQHSPVMRLSFFWFYLSVPVGMGFILLFAILSFVKLILTTKNGGSIPASGDNPSSVDG
ncbi:MAG: TRAP transporter small permease [Treponema sp.]|nr:TRAP transporter small permease [Treponema sp.]